MPKTPHIHEHTQRICPSLKYAKLTNFKCIKWKCDSEINKLQRSTDLLLRKMIIVTGEVDIHRRQYMTARLVMIIISSMLIRIQQKGIMA